jgi:hypothetical protein
MITERAAGYLPEEYGNLLLCGWWVQFEDKGKCKKEVLWRMNPYARRWTP